MNRLAPETLGRLDDPVHFPGVVVFHPALDPALRYIAKSELVEDPQTGERFYKHPGHNQGLGYFGLMSAAKKEIVGGGYYIGVAVLPDGDHATVIDIVGTYLGGDPAKAVEFDAGRLATFFKALWELEHHELVGEYYRPGKVIVVDSREVRSKYRITRTP